MSDDEAGCNLLKNPLSLSDLVGSGTKFEMNIDFDDKVYGSDGEDDEVEGDEVEVDGKTLISPWTKPFSELKIQMKAINEHLFKRVIVAGDTEKGQMPEKSRVCISYNAYWEGEGAPFDSSFLRGSAFNFYTGCFSVLEGLEAAVLTMHQGEQAQFLISYQLLFGEMGCPPRIKQRADGLFIIELISFNAVGDVNAEQAISTEDKKKYVVVVEKVKQIHLKGRDFFGQGMYRNACRAFEKAVNLLNFCHLENEEQERDQTTFLIKLHTNLAVCYNKINMPNKACLMCQETRRLTNNQPSCKSVFQEGRALLMLGDYERSRDLLVCAQHMEPQNAVINKELKDLESRSKTYRENEKTICRKAMGIKHEPKTIDNDSSEFKQSLVELLPDFQKSNVTAEFPLPSGMTKQEIKTVDELTKQFKMRLNFEPVKGTYSISKE